MYTSTKPPTVRSVRSRATAATRKQCEKRRKKKKKNSVPSLQSKRVPSCLHVTTISDMYVRTRRKATIEGHGLELGGVDMLLSSTVHLMAVRGGGCNCGGGLAEAMWQRNEGA